MQIPVLPVASIWDFDRTRIHFFHKYLLSMYFVTNTVVGTVATVENKTVKIIICKCCETDFRLRCQRIASLSGACFPGTSKDHKVVLAAERSEARQRGT